MTPAPSETRGNLDFSLGTRFAYASEDAPIVRHFDFRNYQVRHTATVTNEDADLTQLEVWLPVAGDGREQRITQVSLVRPGKLLSERHAAGQVARFLTIDPLPERRASAEYSVEYTVSVGRMEADLKKVNAFTWRDLEKLPLDPVHLRNEKLIAADEERVLWRARQMKQETSGPGPFARMAYDWVLDQMTYQRREQPTGVRESLDAKSGECSEYSALFVALCRAAGIPARPVVGFRLTGVPNDRHVWAEFRIPTGEWVPVDGAGGDGAAAARDHYFGRRGNSFVGVMKAYEVELETAAREYRKVDYLQAGVFWWRGRNVQAAPRCSFAAIGKPVVK